MKETEESAELEVSFHCQVGHVRCRSNTADLVRFRPNRFRTITWGCLCLHMFVEALVAARQHADS